MGAPWAYFDTVVGRAGALRLPRRRAKRQATEPSASKRPPFRPRGLGRGNRSAISATKIKNSVQAYPFKLRVRIHVDFRTGFGEPCPTLASSKL